MGNYEQLKQAVSDVIKTNGNQEISGAIMQNVLLSIISTIGANATYAGYATPETNPGTQDENVFWIASRKGIYSNFNNIEIDNIVCVLSNKNNSWKKTEIGIPTYQFVEDIKNNYSITKNTLINNAINLYIESPIYSDGEIGIGIVLTSDNEKIRQITLYNEATKQFVGQLIKNEGLEFGDLLQFQELNQSGIVAYSIIDEFGFKGLKENIPRNRELILNNVYSKSKNIYIANLITLNEVYNEINNRLTGIENQISDGLDFVPLDIGKNKFNKSDKNCIIGSYINNYGVITKQEFVSITGKINVKQGDIVKYNQTNFPTAYWENYFLYDDNDNLLDSSNSISYNVTDINASYIRMNIYVLNTDAWDASKPAGERNLGFPTDLMICIVKSDDEDLGEYEPFILNVSIQETANEYTDKEIKKLKEEIQVDKIRYIPCIGNSLTMGAGVGDYFTKTYPARLKQICESNNINDVEFENCGVGGETIAAIAARQGAIPMLTRDDIVIPANTQDTVNLSFDSSWGGIYKTYDNLTFTFQGYNVPNFNNIKINPCYIENIEGELSIVSPNVFSFRRLKEGTSKTIKAKTPIICNMSKVFSQPYAAIFELGANGCYSDTNDYVAQVETCSLYYSISNILIIGCHYVTETNTRGEYKSTLADRLEQEEAFTKRFGNKFLNLRKLLSENGIEYAKELDILADDYIPTQEDIEAMERGECPPVFLSDAIHFNEKGYYLKAYYIYDRLKQIGIL